MDNICTEIERLSQWLTLTPAVSVCYAEAGVESEPRTGCSPLLELLFQERGRIQLEVGNISVDLQGGMVALINAHFGNRGSMRSEGARYACVSFNVPNVQELARLGHYPLLLAGKVRNLDRVGAAYRAVCRVRHSPPQHLPEVWMKSAVLHLVAVLYEELSDDGGRTQVSLVGEALRVLAERQSDPNLTLTGLAKSLHCSPSHLGRIFRREMGMGPMGHLTQLRVHRAQHLLTHTRLGIKEVAYHVGLHDPLYFSRLFHKTCGTSPRSYRKSLH